MKKIVFLIAAVILFAGFASQAECSQGKKRDIVEKNGLTFNAVLAKTLYRYPEPVIIELGIKRKFPVSFAYVEAVVTRPDGTFVRVPMTDRGDASILQPIGGRYQGVFSDFSGDGRYNVSIRAANVNSQAREGTLFAVPSSPDLNGQFKKVGENLVSMPYFDAALSLSFTLEGWIPDDSTAPGKIYEVQLDENQADSAVISWFPVGSDGYVGRADHYEVRYASEPIATDAAWEDATEYPQHINPRSAGGAVERLLIKGIPAGNYYFSVKAVDKAGNVGPVSGAVYVTISQGRARTK